MVDALLDLLLGEFAQLESERHVLEHRHMRVQRVILEHHGDVAVFRRQVVDDVTADIDVARGHFLESGDHAQRRRLAAAGRADQHNEFVVRDIEIDAANRFDIVVALDHITQRDFGHLAKPFVSLWWRPR